MIKVNDKKPNDKLVLRPKSYKKKDQVVVSCRMEEQLVKRIDEAATKVSRSRNELISILCEYALDHIVFEE